LATIKPNFPPGILQGDTKYSNLYFNMSSGNAIRAPWNQGETMPMGDTWQYIEDPIKYVMETNSLLDQKLTGTNRTEQQVQNLNEELSEARSKIVNKAAPIGPQQWNKPLTEDDLEVSLENGNLMN